VEIKDDGLEFLEGLFRLRQQQGAVFPRDDQQQPLGGRIGRRAEEGRSFIDQRERVEELMDTDFQSRQEPVKNLQTGQLLPVFEFRKLAFSDSGFLSDLSLAFAPKIPDQSKGVPEILKQRIPLNG
jgi:hypothetical protein